VAAVLPAPAFQRRALAEQRPRQLSLLQVKPSFFGGVLVRAVQTPLVLGQVPAVRSQVQQ
jgi:hypothetical protein